MPRHQIPPHLFVEPGSASGKRKMCATCSEAIQARRPVECRMRCPGDQRGTCGMPLRTALEVERQRCTTCLTKQPETTDRTPAAVYCPMPPASACAGCVALRAQLKSLVLSFRLLDLPETLT